MDAGFLSNLVAYSAQIVVLVGAGAIAALVLRMDAAGVRYAYWRVVLVAPSAALYAPVDAEGLAPMMPGVAGPRDTTLG